MASYQKRRRRDGTPRVVALVRIKGFESVSKAFGDMKAARAWAEDAEAKLRSLRDRGGEQDDASRLTIRELCERYLADPNTRSLRSYVTTELFIAWWVNEHGHERVMGFGVAKVRGARASLIVPSRSPATVNRYLAAMRSAWNWGRDAGLVPEGSTWPRKVMLAEPRPRARFLDDRELDSLLKALDDEPPWLRAAVTVAIGTGARQGELLRLRWRDVDLNLSRLTVIESKNGTSRSVHLPGPCVDALRAIAQAPEPDGLVFPVSKSLLDQRWTALRDRIGLEDFRFHDLRHTAASYLAQGGASLLEIGSVLGHKSPSVTMRYAHLVQGAPLPAHSALEGKLRR